MIYFFLVKLFGYCRCTWKSNLPRWKRTAQGRSSEVSRNECNPNTRQSVNCTLTQVSLISQNDLRLRGGEGGKGGGAKNTFVLQLQIHNQKVDVRVYSTVTTISTCLVEIYTGSFTVHGRNFSKSFGISVSNSPPLRSCEATHSSDPFSYLIILTLTSEALRTH